MLRIDLPAKRHPRSSLLRLGKKFELGGVRLPGFPCPINSKGGLMLPAIDYLSERAVYQRVSMGTLVHEAYILREWLAFCEARHRSWTKPDDEFLSTWRSHLEKGRVGRREEDPEAWSRNNRKLLVVNQFYMLMQTVLRAFGTNVIGDPGRDGGTETPLTAVLGPRRGADRKGKEKVLHRVRYGNKPELLIGRPTPRPDAVVKVLDAAADRATDHAASTHYLMARSMAQAGLRAIGVSNLSLAAISQGLLDERIAAAGAAKPSRPIDLHAIATDPMERQRVLDGLTDLEKRRRKHIFIPVTEKRQVTRNVSMPIPLVRELLGYIWDERFRLIEARGSRAITLVRAREVFVSPKTLQAYTATSVATLVGSAFRKADVAGSGHRLRAAYAEAVVRDAYLRARAVHGRNYDPAAIELIVSECLGHKDSRSRKPYLNHLVAEENLLPGEPVLIRAGEHAPAVRALVDALDESEAEVAVLLQEVLKKLDRAVEPWAAAGDHGRLSPARRPTWPPGAGVPGAAADLSGDGTEQGP